MRNLRPRYEDKEQNGWRHDAGRLGMNFVRRLCGHGDRRARHVHARTQSAERSVLTSSEFIRRNSGQLGDQDGTSITTGCIVFAALACGGLMVNWMGLGRNALSLGPD